MCGNKKKQIKTEREGKNLCLFLVEFHTNIIYTKKNRSLASRTHPSSMGSTTYKS